MIIKTEEFEIALQAPISRECWVQIRFQGKPTRQAIEKLTQYMELLKETYADTMATSTTEAEDGGAA